MARSVDVIAQSPPSEGLDVTTLARHTHTHPSLANGVAISGGAAAGSPGAVLGTGANADTYTPGIEAV